MLKFNCGDYKKRNKEIYDLYSSKKATVTEMTKKYGLTRARIYQIIDNEKERHDGKNDLLDDFKNADYSFLERMAIMFDDVDNTKQRLNIRATLIALFRYSRRLRDSKDSHECLRTFMKLDYQYILSLRNIGEKKARIIQEVQDRIAKQESFYTNMLTKNCTKIW